MLYCLFNFSIIIADYLRREIGLKACFHGIKSQIFGFKDKSAKFLVRHSDAGRISDVCRMKGSGIRQRSFASRLRMTAGTFKLPLKATFKSLKTILTSPQAIKVFKSTYFTILMVFAVFTVVYFAASGLQTTHAAGLTKYPITTGGNWSADATWTLNADGTTNATTKPTASDDVVMNSTSGAVTIDATSVAKSLDCTGYTNTLTHNAFTLTVSGSVTLAAGKYTAVGAATLAMNATGTLISAGNTLYNLSTSSGTVTLGDNSTVSSIFTTSTGTLVTDGGTGSLTHNWFRFTTGSTSTITLGNSTINMSCNDGHIIWDMQNTGSMTVNAGTSTINMLTHTNTTDFNVGNTSGPGKTFNVVNLSASSATFSAPGSTFNTVNFTGSGNPSINRSSTFGTLTRTGTAVKTDSLTISSDQTVTGTLSLAGNSATNRLLVQSDTLGTPRAITVTGANLSGTTNVDFQDITFARTDSGALDLTNGGANSIGDCGGNTKSLGDSTTLTMTPSDTQTWTTNASGNWSGANWIGTTVSRVPLPQDDVVMNKGSAYASAVTIIADMPRLGRSIDWTGVTWTGTATKWMINGVENTSYGSLTFIPGITITVGGNNYNLAGRSSYVLTTATLNFIV